MKRRDFLWRVGGTLIAGPTVLHLVGCSVEAGNNDRVVGLPPLNGGGSAGGGGTASTFIATNQDGSGHSHSFTMKCSHLGAGGWVYVAQGPHEHSIAVTEEELVAVFDGQIVTVETSDKHPHTWVLQRPAEVSCEGAPVGGQFSVMNADTSGHSHSFLMDCAQAGGGARVFIAGGAHTHEVSMSAADIDQVFAGQPVTLQTTDLHAHVWVVQAPAGLCG